MFDYNQENLDKAVRLIWANLTPDLLPKKWVDRNASNPMFGHCHTASATLQKLFGSKNITLYRGKDDEGIWHWWAVDKDSILIDLTANQYFSENRIPPYANGEKASMLGYDYRTRVMALLARVVEQWEYEDGE